MALKGIPGLLVALFIIIEVAVIYFRYVEYHTIFYPLKEIEALPEEIGLDFEAVFFKTSDNITLNGWFLPYPEAKYTFLFCHGNAGNISHRLDSIKILHDLGVNVFIFDYRGYGRSMGRPSEKGLYLDVQAAYNYLLSKGMPAERIIGFGKSLGGAAIIDLASKNKLAAIITSSTFTSSKDMAKVIYPYLPYWIFSSRIDSLTKIKSITIPKLIIHSINDDLVPYRLGEKLYQNAATPKEFVQIHGDHNNGFFESEAIVREKIADFIKRLP